MRFLYASSTTVVHHFDATDKRKKSRLVQITQSLFMFALVMSEYVAYHLFFESLEVGLDHEEDLRGQELLDHSLEGSLVAAGSLDIAVGSAFGDGMLTGTIVVRDHELGHESCSLAHQTIVSAVFVNKLLDGTANLGWEMGTLYAVDEKRERERDSRNKKR